MKLRRRQYVNDSGFQMKIILAFAVITLLANIISIGFFNYIALQKMEDLLWSTHINIKTTGEIVNSLFIYVNIINLCCITFLLILMGYWMIRKTTGPLLRMSSDIVKIREGNLASGSSIKKNDEFQDIASEIDTMRKSMRDRFIHISQQHSQVSGSIKNLTALSGQGKSLTTESAKIREHIKKLEQEMDKLQF